MATVYVIHAAEDRAVVERLLRVLPMNGYEYWSSTVHIQSGSEVERAIPDAIDRCAVVLVVLSSASVRSQWMAAEIDLALKSGRPLIPIQTEKLDPGDGSRLPAALWAIARIDLAMEGEREGTDLLVASLPPIAIDSEGAIAPEYGERIAWNEDVFSTSLGDATRRHDRARAESLVSAIVRHFASRPDPYPPKPAAADLQELRQDREFELMRRYGEAVIASGTTKDKVRRLFAQALIETKDYDRALEVLQSIIDDTSSSQREVFEACGLTGRTHKQRYVEASDAHAAADLIRQAIAAYARVYERDHNEFWHGVNAASCILRAHRDGVDGAEPAKAREIAQQIADELERRAKIGPLEVWDCASRIEALLALDRYDDADRALDDYINHPEMRAFEVSSTFRQFDQVLQLGRRPRGASILGRLRNAMERYRAGKFVTGERGTAPEAESMRGASDPTMPLIIRVADPVWEPGAVPDLVIQTRLGKIVTARGSQTTVRALLTDSRVISVEESRPAGSIECDRSVPFVKVAAEYTGLAGKYNETGDRALIAVIDNGIDVLHEAFLDAARSSRILGIWDQRDDSTGDPPQGFAYGTFHDEAAIAGYVKAGKVPLKLGRNTKGHGTHVASIAAGRAAGAFAGGVAPDAKLLFVISAASGPIGYSQSHIEALAFIDAFSTARNLPVVVNVSQGMNAGAHDGKSSLEVAFDAFSDSGRRRGRVVVKSAGNERGKDGHARVTMSQDACDELHWKRVDNAAATERIELWWSSADEMEFRLRDPFNEWSPSVAITSPELQGTLAGGPYRLVFTKRHIDNGDSLLLIELGNANEPAALGDWLLEITSRQVPEGGEIHAWIERSQSAPTAFTTHVDENMTLSIPGTASSVIAVGAVDASTPLKVPTFSSYGPTRDPQNKNKPLVCAPGVNVRAADGGSTNDVRLESGTSMAAPHVTGAIALLLSRMAKSGQIPGGNQIASALRQKTQNYNGRWERGQGYGVIDVGALLGAF